MKHYFPILNWLSNYQKEWLRGDLFAGLTVGVMLIPQGMAYALIAGLPPVYGLYASIVPQIIYALFGTSRQLSVGPVAMDSLLVASGVSVLATEGSEVYITYAILLAFIMGAIQLTLGLIKMGFITHLLAKPVISGFTSAAAFIIGLNQLKYFIGVDIEKSNQIYRILLNAFESIELTHLPTLLLGILGVLMIKGAKNYAPRLPGALIAVVTGILIVTFFGLQDKGVSVVQEIPDGLPSFVLPDLSWSTIQKLLPLALTIGVVAFMEAYSVAKAIESKRRDYQIQPNQELIGLGAANMVGALFQSYPVTGGFSRSAVNDQSGANTPLSSIISAALVAFTLLFLTPLFYYLPHAILASVIMVAVSGLIDMTYARELWKTDKIEFGLLLATFIITLQFGMVPGIVSGIILSILILLFRAANPHMAILGQVKGYQEYRNIRRFKGLDQWDNILIIRIDAPFAFVNIQTIKDKILNEIELKEGQKRHVVLDASSVAYIDATALNGLKELMQSLKEKQVEMIFAEVRGPVRDAFFKNSIVEKGEESFFLTTHDAVRHCLDENHEALGAEFIQQHND